MLRDSNRPLPEALRERLRAIPHDLVVCRDVERLYAAVRRRARGTPVEPAAARHLATCRRCRTLYGTLESALAEPPEAAPPRLRERLRDIARRPAEILPAWIGDARYAAAACWLVTAFLTLLAGDAAALWRDATGAVGTRAAVWAEQSGNRGRRAWDAVGAAVEGGFREGRRSIATGLEASHTSIATGLEEVRMHIEAYGESLETLIREAVREVGSTLGLDRQPSDEGEPDGRADDDPQ